VICAGEDGVFQMRKIKKVLISLDDIEDISDKLLNDYGQDVSDTLEEWFNATPEAPQWISVEDRLPDDGVLVFIFITELNIMTNFAWQLFKIGACYHKENNRWGIMDYSQQGDFLRVTHWMPIPPLGAEND